jgi:replicative DNA helicase
MSNIVGMNGAQVETKNEVEDLLSIQQEMLDTINQVDEYCYNRGRLGGLDWGMESLNNAFEGLQPGLIIVGGQPNVGKSALCMQLGWRIAYANQQVVEGVRPNKAYVLYFSLDDNASEILPRVVAIEENIPINIVKAPVKFEDERPDLIARRANGFKKLKSMLNYFKIIDSTHGTSIEFIENTIRAHHLELQGKDEAYKMVVIIDNFHDITVDEINFRDNENSKFTYISDKLSHICTQFDIPVICTAEFRKLNGNRRPMVDDLRESGKIAYEAKAIMLCYNEVGLRGEAATIYFNRGEAEFANYKQPVLEVKVGKNKYSSYKGRLFYNFYPERSLLREVDAADAQKYSQMVLA